MSEGHCPDYLKVLNTEAPSDFYIIVSGTQKYTTLPYDLSEPLPELTEQSKHR